MLSSFFGNGRGGGTGEDGAAQRALAELRAYWDGLREDGLPPLRSRVDPRGIAGVLEQAFILDRVAPGVARFRIAGMALADVMGMDVRGMPVLSLIDPPARAGFAKIVDPVLTGEGTLDVWLEAERGMGRPALTGRMLLLPLRRVSGEPGLALGALVTQGDIGRVPRRFAIARAEALPLSLPAAPAADAARNPAPAPTPAPMPGLAEAPAAFAGAPARGNRVPYLRLVKTDRAD